MKAKQIRPDTCVRVSLSVHRRLKVLAASRGLGLGDVATEIIKAYLDKPDARKARRDGR